MAKALGVTQATVQRWFARDRVPAEYQARVAELLGVRVGWVAGDGGPPTEISGAGEEFAAGRRAGIEEAIRLLAAAIQGTATPPRPSESTVAGAFEEAADHLPPPDQGVKPAGRRRKA